VIWHHRRKVGEQRAVAGAPDLNGNPTMDLLNQAHVQLRTRKQAIEAELALLE
jgi:hypothetical protein